MTTYSMSELSDDKKKQELFEQLDTDIDNSPTIINGRRNTKIVPNKGPKSEEEFVKYSKNIRKKKTSIDVGAALEAGIDFY